MTINNEFLEKYGLPTLEQYRENMLEGESEEMYYRQILSITDYISNRLIEGSLLTSDCAEELAIREYARQKIAEFKGQDYEIKGVVKTVEERTTDTESILNVLLGLEV